MASNIPQPPRSWNHVDASAKCLAKAGEKLAKLHLDSEKLKPCDLDFNRNARPAAQLPRRRQNAALQGQAPPGGEPLADPRHDPAGGFEYGLGNRSALEWVIDQYQVSEDKRSGITSDPNRADDPEYIVRLVCQVVRVSVETVKLVNDLPAEFEPAAGSAH